ncbi:TIGR04168 family protein [Synechococcus sp. CS-1325]|nr:TIGR04168 family protein [Synechococcus sp. CS-1325]MCT0213234.1 TIGR04168 family protein [Synechococcus sp. CS-1326]MCT0231953.1 TIGR04168 family protein [Synechococcus sp. CS-1327]PZU99595.1 MAG: TIGR04168 family protein [Cyanobium sp.]
MRLAIAGDLHGQWDREDVALLRVLAPDAVLVVGDLSDGQERIAASLANVEQPLACILGNHDTGKDDSGRKLQRQIDLLGNRHCGWRRCDLRPPGLAVVGGRPASAGGGYRLSMGVKALWGPVSSEESAGRIASAALGADPLMPLVLLAHSGPSGLGSEAHDPCGRDWKSPARDWGDMDLALAIDRIQRQRPLPLVAFGHMHHQLRRGRGERRSFVVDRRGTAYLNAACVPRHGMDAQGRQLRHFSWVELDGHRLVHASHRWYSPQGRLLYEQTLVEQAQAVPC